MRLSLANLGQAVPQGSYAGNPTLSIFFCAPIDLLPGDQLIINLEDGELLAVYRESRLIWKRPPTVGFKVDFTITPESARMLAEFLETMQQKEGENVQ